MEFMSFGMEAQDKPSVSPINPTRFEKLLGFATPPQAADMENVLLPKYVKNCSYVDDQLTELMEEDVWGDNDDDTSSVDGDENVTPFNQWPDSESDSHSSTLLYEGAREGRGTGIFSPSQFSLVMMSEREAMRGQIFDSPDIMPLERCASGGINGTHNIIGTSNHNGIVLSNKILLPGYGPRSASVEVPIWSNLRAIMKNGDTFLGLDGSDSYDEEDVSVCRVPPHELLAKQHARNRMSAFSVIEGTGCTLKGRDVSKVRDAVWKQTGFSG